MSNESTNFSDVTLVLRESNLQPICKFNQTGFCMFGDKCRKMHVNTICQNPKNDCRKNGCLNRHPKACKNFKVTGKCRFGRDCAFHHKKSDTTKKVEELETEVNILKAEVQILQNNLLKFKIYILKRDLEELKSVVLSNTQHIEALQNAVKEIKVKISSDKSGFEAWSAGVIVKIREIDIKTRSDISNIAL